MTFGLYVATEEFFDSADGKIGTDRFGQTGRSELIVDGMRTPWPLPQSERTLAVNR
jgi:hypothetical protein